MVHNSRPFYPRAARWEIEQLEAAAARAQAVYLAIRNRINQEDVPLNVAADIDQIICEVGEDWDE